jgi:hypothetical protein
MPLGCVQGAFHHDARNFTRYRKRRCHWCQENDLCNSITGTPESDCACPFESDRLKTPWQSSASRYEIGRNFRWRCRKPDASYFILYRCIVFRYRSAANNAARLEGHHDAMAILPPEKVLAARMAGKENDCASLAHPDDSSANRCLVKRICRSYTICAASFAWSFAVGMWRRC